MSFDDKGFYFFVQGVVCGQAGSFAVTNYFNQALLVFTCWPDILFQNPVIPDILLAPVFNFCQSSCTSEFPFAHCWKVASSPRMLIISCICRKKQKSVCRKFSAFWTGVSRERKTCKTLTAGIIIIGYPFTCIRYPKSKQWQNQGAYRKDKCSKASDPDFQIMMLWRQAAWQEGKSLGWQWTLWFESQCKRRKAGKNALLQGCFLLPFHDPG